MKPDVVAPGVSITSVAANTTNGYAIYSGTSMATPFVVGVSLLMRDANPSLTPQQIKDAMTVDRRGLGPGRAPTPTTAPDGSTPTPRCARSARRSARPAPAVPTHTFQQRHALGDRREHRHHAQRDRHAVSDRGDDDRVERHGRDLDRRRTSTSRCSTRRARRSPRRRRATARTRSPTGRPRPAPTPCA